MTAIAIVVSVFMDSRTAFLSTLIAILISSLSLQEPYLFIFIEIFSSWVAIYSLKQLATRSQLIHTAFLATALTALLMLGIDFSQGHTLRMLDTSWYLSIAINGVLLLFVYPFLFVLEKVFGFTSPITLIEISNINHPLLRELLHASSQFGQRNSFQDWSRCATCPYRSTLSRLRENEESYLFYREPGQ